ISTRYLSQYRAEICHASSSFLCSSGIILVRREANPFLLRRGRTNKFLEARIIPKRIEHWIEPEQRGSERHVCGIKRAFVRSREQRLQSAHSTVGFACFRGHAGKDLDRTRAIHRVFLDRIHGYRLLDESEC